MARKVRSVSFNLEDDYEKQLYDHANNNRFSKYVKRLIDRDLYGFQQQPQVIEEVEQKGNPMSFI